MGNARETALLTLYKVEYEGAYSNMELKKMLSGAGLSHKDNALATALVYGVLQHDIELEYIISKYSSVKLKKISKYILLILKLGVYQLLYTDKIPDSAAVNESVKLSKKYGARSSGFVNGVLRSFLRDGKKAEYPSNKTEYASVKYSFPRELAAEWIKRFGYVQACGLMESMNETAPMCVRINTLKTTKKEMLLSLPNAKEGMLSPDAVYTDGFDIASSEEYKKGYITPQDEAAMLACNVLSPQAGETVIDMCAAPGGKAAYIAQLMENEGKISAFDIYEHKIKLIDENAKRLGVKIIEAKTGNSEEPNPQLEACADRVLADVPCSGLGIIRKKPEIKNRFKKSEDLPKIQYKILENAAMYLKRGGELVYSTCTVQTEENEAVVSRFLKEHDNFEPVDISGFFKGEREDAKKGCVTLYPNIDGTDGFFIAKLKKVR